VLQGKSEQSNPTAKLKIFLIFVDIEKLKLLEVADHETACEFPPGFNHRASMKRVEDLKPKLNAIIGRPLELDLHVQDASFFTDLAILEPPNDGVNVYHYVLGIRFSSFGNFFTVWSNSVSEKIEDAKIAQVIAETEAAGFIYVDAETLEQKYTGKNQYLVGEIENWWSRFFDYL
jgi:hypothetical protein